MKCIYCGCKSLVVDSAPLDKNYYRRRRCNGCGALFYTQEKMISANNFDMREAFTLKDIAKKDRKWQKLKGIKND